MEMDRVAETGIREQVIMEICEIAKRCQVDKVLLFGSRARGDFKRTVTLTWLQPEGIF